MKILMIEDDPLMTKLVAGILEVKWPEVNFIHTALGEEGIERTKKESPNIIILDLMLPDTDGFRVLRQIRSFSDVPLVILTAKAENDFKIRGLEEGADDYIVKPFLPGELVARLQSLLRRTGMTEPKVEIAEKSFISGNLSIDFTSRTVSVDGHPVNLGPRGYKLLYRLVTNEGKVVSNQELLEEVFPENSDDIRFLNVYINKVKEILGDNPDDPKTIINEGETGYKFVRS